MCTEGIWEAEVSWKRQNEGCFYNKLWQLLLKWPILGGILVMVRKNVRNFAPSKRKCAYLRDPRDSFCLIKPKKLWIQLSSTITRLNNAEESTLTADKLPLPFAETSWRPTECFREWKKLSNGRQSTRSCRTEYSHGRQRACYDCGRHSDGRQSACYDCENIPTGDRIRDAIGWSILTVDRVLATTAETFRRETECFLSLRKHRNVRQST